MKDSFLEDDKSQEDLEKERRRFEEQLDEQEMELLFDLPKTKPALKPKGNQKKILTTLLISIGILVILFTWMYSYASNHYGKANDETITHIYNVLQVSTSNYCKKYKKYPMTNQGYVDLDLLRNKGYLNLDVEVDNSIFMIGNNCRVILRQPD